MPQPWSHLTIICQDVCWTKLTLNYSVWRSGIPQPVLSPPRHRSKAGGGGTSSRTWLWRDFSLAELTRQRKPTPAVFEGAWLIGAAPKVDADGRIPSGFACRNFKEERRHSRDEWTHSWSDENVTTRTQRQPVPRRRMSRRNCIIF